MQADGREQQRDQRESREHGGERLIGKSGSRDKLIERCDARQRERGGD